MRLGQHTHRENVERVAVCVICALEYSNKSPRFPMRIASFSMLLMLSSRFIFFFFFFFQAEDGIRDWSVTGVQTCALPISYTFSKALGLQSVNESGDLIDPVDARHRSWGVLPYDRTHVLNVSYSYQLPDGARGGFRNRLTAGALNGWQVSGITSYSSGMPYRLNFGGELSQAYTAIGFFGSNAYSTSVNSSSAIAPVFTSNPSRGGTAVGDKILDINSLAISAFGQSGPHGLPFYLRSPNRSNTDFSVFKNFPI